MKLWRPSYCACIIEEIYNGTEIVGGGQIIRKCEPHASVPDADLYDVLLNGESRPAMVVYTHLIKTALGADVVDPEDGITRRAVRQDLRLGFSYNGEGRERELVVSLAGGTPADRQLLAREVPTVTLNGKPVRIAD